VDLSGNLLNAKYFPHHQGLVEREDPAGVWHLGGKQQATQSKITIKAK
jgi:hypothetical protein